MIITRFAPSPTGDLHLGGARTALYNWLFARQNKGTMLLRIEDTDRERSTDAARDAVIDAMTWLGIDWHGSIIFQHQHLSRHQEVAMQLLEAGRAYRCYASQNELAQAREQAQASGNPYRYDGRWRDGGISAGLSTPAAGTPFSVRIKCPKSGNTSIDDLVQGTVSVANSELDDFILLRSDGTPTYMLGVVVDDFDAGVTHVIRGDDHLTNAIRQVQIYDAMGWKRPLHGHIPLIQGPDGAKLSKRHGAVSVQAWRDAGYLPEAICNALVRLGWGHGNQEIFSQDEMLEHFSITDVGRGAARFDPAKLDHLNRHYIKQLSPAEVIDRLDRHISDETLSRVDSSALALLMPGLCSRATTLIDIVNGAEFLFRKRPIELNAEAVAIVTPQVREMLARIHRQLSTIDDWNNQVLESCVREFVKREQIKLVQLAQPLRAALTGSTKSVGIFDIMSALGSRETLARIADVAGI